jgi:serine/threonine-protein kinase
MFLSGNFPAVSEPTATQQIIPSSTATNIPPTETIEAVTSAPSETPAPVETSIPDEIKDNRNVTMRLVPAGEFTMGSDDTGDVGSRPAHTVYVDAFYIDKFEVTNEMYDACVYAVECRKPARLGTATRDTYFGNPVYNNYPVIYVDWKMAKAYCEWRGARLPTEAEWEKAARGTDLRLYPWGDDKPDCNFGNISGCVGDTTPVDQHEKGQSIYGIYGLAGNVWEWTSSLFDYYPYDATDGREDSDALDDRIARGGSWHPDSNSGNVRVDTRLRLPQLSTLAYVGIRCAVSVTK